MALLVSNTKHLSRPTIKPAAPAPPRPLAVLRRRMQRAVATAAAGASSPSGTGDANARINTTSSESDTDEEIRAKAAVMDLLQHPEEVGEQLIRQSMQQSLQSRSPQSTFDPSPVNSADAAAGQQCLTGAAKAEEAAGTRKGGGGGFGGVSIAWLKALVDAATRGDVGTLAHQRQQQQQHKQQQRDKESGGGDGGGGR